MLANDYYKYILYIDRSLSKFELSKLLGESYQEYITIESCQMQ